MPGGHVREAGAVGRSHPSWPMLSMFEGGAANSGQPVLLEQLADLPAPGAGIAEGQLRRGGRLRCDVLIASVHLSSTLIRAGDELFTPVTPVNVSRGNGIRGGVFGPECGLLGGCFQSSCRSMPFLSHERKAPRASHPGRCHLLLIF